MTMRWLDRVGFRFLKEQTGFSLIEAIVAVAILGLIGVAVLRALDTNYRAVGILDEQVVATNLITVYFEAIKDCEYSEEYPIDQPPLNSIIIPPGYDVHIRTDFSTDGGVIWFDDYTDNALQKIRISISHEGDGKPVLSMCTFRTDF